MTLPTHDEHAHAKATLDYIRKTMESAAYGHPGEPKEGPEDALPFAGWRSGRFGLTFEKDGLRARCELAKAPAGG